MNRIKKLRNEFDISQEDLAKTLNLSKGIISLYENEARKPSMEVLVSLSEIFNVSIDYLIGKTEKRNNNIDSSGKLFAIPIVGRVPAGSPLLTNENIEGYLPIDPIMYNMTSPDGFFFLKVQGESMNKVIKNGAFALIKKQDIVADGDVVVAIVNGDNEATMKKYKQLNSQFVMLEPCSEDSSFEPITIDLKTTTFKIIGKVVGDFKRWE